MYVQLRAFGERQAGQAYCDKAYSVIAENLASRNLEYIRCAGNWLEAVAVDDDVNGFKFIIKNSKVSRNEL